MSKSLINIVFFSKYREIFGSGCLQLDFSEFVTQGRCSINVAFLMDVLRQKYGADKTAFFDDSKLLVSINHELVDRHCDLEPGDEVAFFPPVTGG